MHQSFSFAHVKWDPADVDIRSTAAGRLDKSGCKAVGQVRTATGHRPALGTLCFVKHTNFNLSKPILRADKIVLERIPLDIHKLLDFAVSVSRPAAATASIEVVVDLGIPKWVFGDETHPRQVL